MAMYKGAASEAGRALQLKKKREKALEELEHRKRKIENEMKLSNIENKFATHYDAVEQQLKSSTIGLVTLDEMKAKQEDVVKERERQLAQKQHEKELQRQREIRAKQEAKERQKRQIAALSFRMDEDEEHDDDIDEDDDEETAEKKNTNEAKDISKVTKDPDTESSFSSEKKDSSEERIKESNVAENSGYSEKQVSSGESKDSTDEVMSANEKKIDKEAQVKEKMTTVKSASSLNSPFATSSEARDYFSDDEEDLYDEYVPNKPVESVKAKSDEVKPDEAEPDDTDSTDDEPAVKRKKIGKNPDVDTSFLPDRDREEEEERLREELRQEWVEKQEKMKNEEIEITFSYWDGSGHRRNAKMKKGNSVYQFLQKCLEILRKEFHELRAVTADQLMYVKEDLIVPHHYTFYDFIVTKARGKSGPLFSFDVHEDVRLVNDATVEKDESHAGKVLLRSWYERNKHIFPASRWEPYDPTKSYERYTVADRNK